MKTSYWSRLRAIESMHLVDINDRDTIRCVLGVQQCSFAFCVEPWLLHVK